MLSTKTSLTRGLVSAFTLLLCGCALFGSDEPEHRSESDCYFQHEIFRLDLDEDGTTDFVVGMEGLISHAEGQLGSDSYIVCPERGNQVIFVEHGGAAALEAGAAIDGDLPPSHEWRSREIGMYTLDLGVIGRPKSRRYVGLWADVEEAYLGLKLFRGGSPHYGWARVSVDTSSSNPIALEGQAYNPTPGQSIQAGHEK